MTVNSTVVKKRTLEKVTLKFIFFAMRLKIKSSDLIY
jgi:hypothetical protein